MLLIGQFTSLLAQQPMLAYRKEGIWHYFNTDGQPMWEPYLDIAGSPAGWVNDSLCGSTMDVKSTNGGGVGFERKQVLYNVKGDIAFRPKLEIRYKILSGFDEMGLIEIQNYETTQLVLCDKAGNMVYECPNMTGQYLGNGVVAYLKTEEELTADGEKNYLLFDVKTKKEIAQITCSGIRGNFRNGAIFCHNAALNWGMVNREGQLILPMIWDADLLEDDGKTGPLNFGFIALKDPKTSLFSLINKNGDVVLTEINEIVSLSKDYFQCRFKTEDYRTTHTYVLEGTKITEIDLKYGENFVGTEGSLLLRKDVENNLTITDKTLKPIAKIKSFKYSGLEVFEHHIWTQTDTTNEFAFTCYNEKGVKTGTIIAEKWGKSAYGHVPFMRNGLRGLATESGKIVVKPTYTFKEDNIPDVQNGYWSVPVPLNEDSVRFDFYNFQGKLTMRTTAEKDGWDFIISNEATLRYRHF